ncbi:MAG: hypothetical protein CO073_01040 [Candidatus Komeilibacteria bacterium CG_4_9_14_0_8_um_filter_36_9]|uniref:Cell envelope-related transcriptional attenuator domain-containing protein n=1 Tax=Candidatus Komeilibacteria bacterium CG_4_9_14_0_8_um_filter_36_9 TaxID=1974473 RepID=A0A2M8DS23_9BACT|nr:MAG: hypothetical protein CO073_01040 [Candidatus Komeilibacteria bacterium CG_4_9_14_0_8_um_filter_36_9]
MKKKVIIISVAIVLCLCIWLLAEGVFRYQANASTRAFLKSQDETIENILFARRLNISEEKLIDPFGEDGVIQILFIGLDTRVGQEVGHCDAIQLISIDTKGEGSINITAVPRGTYSPLPPGKDLQPSDYYISNACGLGGLEYGIQQIEKILGVKPDYLMVVGFSETMGILRYLNLPTTGTLQWLRNRHGYAIGELQRAHNHSTFIKQMLIKFVPTEQTKLNTALQYLVYNLIKTDLSFVQAQKIIDTISAMDIANHPEKIQLSIRPFHLVEDIAYDAENISKYLEETLGPITKLLSEDDYSDITGEKVQSSLLSVIGKNKDNPDFIIWAYQNNLWLQIENDEQRLIVQFDLLKDYLPLLQSSSERRLILEDYILEMENRGEPTWQAKGKDLLMLEI